MAQATAAGYPVSFSVQQADRFERAGILLRMVLWVVLSSVPVGIVLLFGPVITAVLIMQRGGDGFLSEYGAKYQRILRFVLGANAYLLFCTEVIPSWEKPEEGPTQLEIRTTGSPSVGSALLRYIMAYPHLIILGDLGLGLDDLVAGGGGIGPDERDGARRRHAIPAALPRLGGASAGLLSLAGGGVPALQSRRLAVARQAGDLRRGTTQILSDPEKRTASGEECAMAQATVSGYPVTFSLERSEQFRRVGLPLRLALGVAMYFIAEFTLAAVILLSPVVTALLIARRGGPEFLSRYAGTYGRVLNFLLGASGYMLLATDEVPSWSEQWPGRLEIRTTGSPTVGSALLRIITVIPHGIALRLLGIVAAILASVASVSVLINKSVPAKIIRFQERYLVWEARVLAYYVSLVEEYPPFRLGD